jgi:tRNA(Ile)-lysidine synthase TilS/MesJ
VTLRDAYTSLAADVSYLERELKAMKKRDPYRKKATERIARLTRLEQFCFQARHPVVEIVAFARSLDDMVATEIANRLESP